MPITVTVPEMLDEFATCMSGKSLADLVPDKQKLEMVAALMGGMLQSCLLIHADTAQEELLQLLINQMNACIAFGIWMADTGKAGINNGTVQ